MESRIARELKLRFHPVAIVFTDEKPEEALQFKEGAWGCAVAMLNAAADRGQVAVFDRQTFGCTGGGTALGFGNRYIDFPGGIEYLLSTGRGEGFREGEHFKRTPELAKEVFDQLPVTDIPYTYVVFKPLEMVDLEKEMPQLVCLYCNPDQLAALVALANYYRHGTDNVIIPFGSGCQTLCLLPYYEAQQERPRAVVGMTDVSQRWRMEPDILSFVVPFKMFLEMEANVPGSFLEMKTWQKLSTRISGPPVAVTVGSQEDCCPSSAVPGHDTETS
ncbi:MAG: DUF169 domain-containing protein [Chloroflexi bacterium]|nr:DUF169 domain-containing protein [Chloroflexota bacterium]